jgi:hypothetical protein
MAKQDWTPSTVTPGHLQKLMKHGFIAAVELEACCMSEDLVFHATVEGYVVSFMAFYEWGFSTVSSLTTTVLRPRASSPVSLESLAYSGLCEFV